MKCQPRFIAGLALLALLSGAGCNNMARRPGPVAVGEPPAGQAVVYFLVWNTAANQTSYSLHANGQPLVRLVDKTYVAYACVPGDLELSLEPLNAGGARATGSFLKGAVVGLSMIYLMGPAGPVLGLAGGTIEARETLVINKALREQDNRLILHMEAGKNYFVACDLQPNRREAVFRLFELDPAQARQRMIASREVFPKKPRK